METFPLLLLGLGLVLAEAPENTMEIINEEFAEEKMQSEIVKSGQEKAADEVLMNLTLLDKNASLGLSKDVLPSSLLTFRLYYSTPKRDSPVNDKECRDNTMAWRKVSEANGLCKSSSDFIHGPVEVIHRVGTASSCKCGQKPGVGGCESPGLENTVCPLTPGKQFPRCPHHGVSSLKKILTALAGHSLMSWLVSSSKL